MLDELWQRFLQHDRLALSRLLTLVDREENTDRLKQRLQQIVSIPHGLVIAVTGSGGVGKSTLIGRMIDFLRDRSLKVAVLACDPESPVTGGALLGDRIRMPSRADDDGLFIRSLAVPSGKQGIAGHLELMTGLLKTYGFDILIIETVGAGQGDTAIRDIADILVVLVQPETGDELQWEKAGQLEVADVVVVNKGDLPGAQRVESQLRDLLNLPGCRTVPIVRLSAAKNSGIDTLWSTVESLRVTH